MVSGIALPVLFEATGMEVMERCNRQLFWLLEQPAQSWAFKVPFMKNLALRAKLFLGHRNGIIWYHFIFHYYSILFVIVLYIVILYVNVQRIPGFDVLLDVLGDVRASMDAVFFLLVQGQHADDDPRTKTSTWMCFFGSDLYKPTHLMSNLTTAWPWVVCHCQWADSDLFCVVLSSSFVFFCQVVSVYPLSSPCEDNIKIGPHFAPEGQSQISRPLVTKW